MLEIMVFAYGLIVSFILTSANRNVRLARPHGTALLAGARIGFGFSATLAVLLFGWTLATLAA